MKDKIIGYDFVFHDLVLHFVAFFAKLEKEGKVIIPAGGAGCLGLR
jgi:hypothetical protein